MSDGETIRAKVTLDDIMAEQEEIEKSFLALRFAQKIRQSSIACYKQCGGKIKFPFRLD
jgi:hypothetical protein